jgi:hypothetical protein
MATVYTTSRHGCSLEHLASCMASARERYAMVVDSSTFVMSTSAAVCSSRAILPERKSLSRASTSATVCSSTPLWLPQSRPGPPPRHGSFASTAMARWSSFPCDGPPAVSITRGRRHGCQCWLNYADIAWSLGDEDTHAR